MHNTLFGGDNLHLLILSLSAWFGLGAAFYVFRLVCSGYLQRVNGYFDRENEFWHGACMLGMVGCLTPWVLPWPALAWTALFAVGAVWYIVRAFTYGKKLTYNKQWYDLAHAAMLSGMAWMFAMPVSHPVITVAWTAYWVWFGSYYVYRLALDFKHPHWLGFGQDIAHLAMAVVMALMTVWPATFMPYHGGHHHHEMPMGGAMDGPICGPDGKPVQPEATPGAPASGVSPDGGMDGMHHHGGMSAPGASAPLVTPRDIDASPPVGMPMDGMARHHHDHPDGK